MDYGINLYFSKIKFITMSDGDLGGLKLPFDGSDDDFILSLEKRDNLKIVQKLLKTQKKYLIPILKIEGVWGFGIGSDGLVVYMENKDDLYKIPRELDGVPVVIEISEAPPSYTKLKKDLSKIDT